MNLSVFPKRLFIARFCTTLPKEYAEKRAEFWRQEKQRETRVNLKALSEEELAIHNAHHSAICKGYFTYDDPMTKAKIWTRYNHFLKQRCCGEACRHCIYDYECVPTELKKTKTFNGSFWVDNPETENNQTIFKELFNKIRIKSKIK